MLNYRKKMGKRNKISLNHTKNVLFFGVSNVGKSTIMKKMGHIYNHLSKTSGNTLNPKFSLQLVEAHVYDAPCFRRLSIASADAIVLTYAVDDTDSFAYVTTVLDEITAIRGSNFPLIVAANKSDIEVSEIDRIIEDCIIVIDYGCKHIDTIATADTDTGVLEISGLLLGYFTKVSNATKTNYERKSTGLSAFLLALRRLACLH